MAKEWALARMQNIRLVSIFRSTPIINLLLIVCINRYMATEPMKDKWMLFERFKMCLYDGGMTVYAYLKQILYQ